MMHKRGETENNICVNCKKNKVEKSSHILLCTNEKATEFYHKKVKEELKKELEKRHTSSILRDTIIDILTKWRQKQAIDYTDYSQQYKIRDAVLEQKKIGWTNFVLGRFSPKWQISQDIYYTEPNKQQSSQRWLTAIVKKFLLICWDVWDFQNNLIHRKVGRIDRVRNKELCFQI